MKLAVTHSFVSLALLFLFAAANTVDADTVCQEHTVDFIVLEGEATLLALEDDIRADLQVVGVNVTTRLLPKDDFNAAMVAGDFNMAFS
eukprot:gene4190-5168_t